MTLHEEIRKLLIENYTEGSYNEEVIGEIIAKVETKTIERVLAAIEIMKSNELSFSDPDKDRIQLLEEVEQAIKGVGDE